MIKVVLEDFQKYRKDLYEYASNLLRGRGFVERNGELEEFANDVIQNVYLKFHSYELDAYVNENHLFSSLKMFVYREFLNTIDINRKGAQYILLKKGSVDNRYKEEFKQLNIRSYVKPIQEEFDCISAFKSVLNDVRQALIVDELLKGMSQVEITKELNVSLKTIVNDIRKIKDKYIIYAKNTNS